MGIMSFWPISIMYLCLAVLVLRCTGFSLVVVCKGYSLVWVCKLLIVVASLVMEHRLWGMWLSSCGSQILEHRLNSCGKRA